MWNFKRLLSIIMTLALSLSLLPAVTPPAIAAPLTPETWNDGDTITAQSLTDCEVTVNGTVTLTGTLACSGEVVFAGSGTIQRDASFTGGPMADLKANADVTLDGVTVDGNNILTSSSAIQMNSDGTKLTLESGGIINNLRSSANGSAVGINSFNSASINAHFIMNGGVISGNSGTTYGGAVYIGGDSSNASCGRFTMNGGTISGNSQTGTGSYGGIVYVRGVFTMTDGIITDNDSAGRGGAVYVSSYAQATIQGGMINGNRTTYAGYGGNDADIFFSSDTEGLSGQSLDIYGEANIGKLYVLLSNALIYPSIRSTLQNPITMTFGGNRLSVGEIVAKGNGYTLTTEDMRKIFSNNAPALYLLLDEENNQIVFADTDPFYVTPEERLRMAAAGTPYPADPNWNGSTQTYELTNDFDGETGNEPILTEQLDILADFALDLNGHTLTIEVSASPTNGVKIASGITLIVKDTSASGTGTLNVTVTTSGFAGYGAAINTTDGSLILAAGTVNATGVTGGAGIGGGSARSGGTIIINGGTVNAIGGGGGSGGAGIGGGGNGGGSGGSITINGGTVNATGGSGGAGIGGGGSGDGGSITINGGKITAVAGNIGPSAIGNGALGSAGTVTVTGTYNYWVNTGTTRPATQTGSGTFTNNSSYRYVELVPAAPVTNISGSATVTYSGDTFDLSAIAALFTVDAGAGARTYTIEAGGTGTGSIGADNKTLTVTAAGILNIGLATEATATHEAGAMVTAALTVNKGTQAAPAGLGKTNTTGGANNGKITGVDSTMEFMLSTASTWTGISGTSVTGLSAGTYLVRYAETDLYEASGYTDITIAAGISNNDGSADVSGGSYTPQTAPTPPSQPTNTDSVVFVDGKETSAGEVIAEDDKTTVMVDQNVLNDEIEHAADNVAIMIPPGTGVAEAVLVVKNIDDMTEKDMTLIIVVGNVQYEIPAAAVDTAAILSALGAFDPVDVPLNIAITANIGADNLVFVREAANVAGMELVLPPMEFTITATYNGQTYDVTEFVKYVSRTIEITPEQAKQITTAVVIEPDGTTRHVPTFVFEKDGKWYATVNSLTNSTYALVYSEKTFDDTEGKWYDALVGEMGSRGIIDGISKGLFDGEREITRAEFTAIIVRALGLPTVSSRGPRIKSEELEDEKNGYNSEVIGQKSKFSDVARDSWYFGAVETAYEYGLVGGERGTQFAPDRPITREEVMVIIWRAAKLAGFTGDIGTLDAYSDAGSLSAWALDAAMWGAGSKMLTSSGGMLNPAGSMSRAEAAGLILRFLQKAGLVDERSSTENAFPGVPPVSEPRKKPEAAQMPDGSDVDSPNPGGDGKPFEIDAGSGDSSAALDLVYSGGGQMTPQEAIRELNSLLAMCQAVWR